MNKMPEKINNAGNISEQREILLHQNEDVLYGVYDDNSESSQSVKLALVPNILTCYDNKFSGLQGKAENSDITILSLNSLMKGETKVLGGPEIDVDRKFVLLSNGVIDYVIAKNKDGEEKRHVITTTRDGAAAAGYKRTTTAGRNIGWNLQEELEREQVEESPFLGKNSKGEYVLCSANASPEYKEVLKASIQRFLDEKYDLDSENPEDLEKIKIFERTFGFSYSQLGEVLTSIVGDDTRILSYTHTLGDIPEIDTKVLSLSGGNGKESQGEYFVYYDEKNHTYEYRSVQQILDFPEDFQPLNNRPTRLYLESRIQRPQSSRIENTGKGAVPTVEYVSQKVRESLNK